MTMFGWGGLVLLYVALSLGTAAPSGAEPQNTSEDQNLATIKSAFDAWRAGTGSPFDKLSPDATWTIVGNSVVAGAYHGKAVSPITTATHGSCECVTAKSSTSQRFSIASPSTTSGSESPRPHNRVRLPEPTTSQF